MHQDLKEELVDCIHRLELELARGDDLAVRELLAELTQISYDFVNTTEKVPRTSPWKKAGGQPPGGAS